MLVLGVDAALAECSVALVADDDVLVESRQRGVRGQAALLAPMIDAALKAADRRAMALDGIAATVGPGSFTGLRAGIALAQGIGLAIARPVVGVTVREAFAAALPPRPGWTLWVAIDSRRGRIFLDDGIAIRTPLLSDLPTPAGLVAIAGDAAIEVAARFATSNTKVMLTDAREPRARHVASVGLRRLRGELPPLSAQPLYVDPPEVRLPAVGLRPPPA